MRRPLEKIVVSEAGGGKAVTKRLGELLMDRGVLSAEDLKRALVIQRSRGLPLGETLVAEEMVSRKDVLETLSDKLGVPFIDLDRSYGDPLVLDIIPKEKAFELKVIPLYLVEKQLTVALPDPENLAKLSELHFLTGKQVLPVLALAQDLERHIEEYYGELDPASEDAAITFENETGDEVEGVQLDELSEDRPAVRLVNLIIARAIQERASDIHIEPQASSLQVRFRIDGSLQLQPFVVPASAVAVVISRVKILSQMDISERRIPQDGKVQVTYRGNAVDVRVSTLPTIHGEKAVLRLLEKDRQDFSLETIGLSRVIQKRWKNLLARHEGIVLVTGPTGSGKTSTLYATLKHIHRPEVNIITLEDPVEYELPGICQSQVNEKANYSFATGLRSILRQDPDVILVGEIRDVETAHIAVQAALTGHLVLATLHTNDAPSAIARLVDMGVPRFLLSTSLLGVLAQRLVRRGCPDCIRPVEPSDDELEVFGGWLNSGLPFEEGAGCDHCRDIGYKGRVGVHELISVDDDVRRQIVDNASEREYQEALQRAGYIRMWWDGLSKVQDRSTTFRELAHKITPDIPEGLACTSQAEEPVGVSK